MALEWRLRNVMAKKGIWSGSELRRLMEEKAGYRMTAPSISALLNNSPKSVKADTMDALCTALDCTPSDLWKHTATYTDKCSSKTNIELNSVVNENRLPPI
jgi:DNA-binding Xre family transcriptional regulator